MNRSYSKIRHIQEANSRLEKRMLSEQIHMDDMGAPSDEPQLMDRPSEEDAQKSNLINNVIPMLEEIVNNFMDIDCNNVGGFEDYNKTPEYVQTYCRHYNGKTRSQIFHLLKKYKQQVEQ